MGDRKRKKKSWKIRHHLHLRGCCLGAWKAELRQAIGRLWHYTTVDYDWALETEWCSSCWLWYLCQEKSKCQMMFQAQKLCVALGRWLLGYEQGFWPFEVNYNRQMEWRSREVNKITLWIIKRPLVWDEEGTKFINKLFCNFMYMNMVHEVPRCIQLNYIYVHVYIYQCNYAYKNAYFSILYRSMVWNL